MNSKVIVIQNLSKKYKDADDFSVTDLTLNINRNEIFGLLMVQERRPLFQCFVG